MKEDQHFEIPTRHLYALGAVLLVFLLLASRAAYLQLVATDMLQAEGKARYLRNEIIKPNRGLIKDRNGELLAVSTPVDSIWAEPHVLINHPQRWPELAEMIGVSASRIETSVRRYNAKDRRFMYLKRHLTPQHAAEISELEIPGVNLLREYRRYYPLGEIASNLVGYTDIDDLGLEGVELTKNAILQGEAGLRQVLKDRTGRTIETVQHMRRVEDGEDVTLSIDSRIQHVVYRELINAIDRESASKAIGVVVDVVSGEILAIASVPSFNPNVIAERDITRNYAATDVFEPGSVVKPLVVAKALMDGVVSPDTLFDTSPGTVRVGGYKISDIRDFGELSVRDIIMKSSNIGVMQIGGQMDPDEVMEFYNQVGFGSLTGSSLSGEEKGLFPRRSIWRDSERATLSFGYGFSVTALQLVQAYAAFANDGILVPLSIIPDQPSGLPRRQIVPSSVAAEMVDMLERVCSPQGTSRKAKVPLYRVAGKSATVQKLINGAYSSENHLAMFVGFAPVSNPRLAMAVIIDDPRGKVHYGGAVAAPVFREVMSAALRILDIPPDDIEQLAMVDERAVRPGNLKR